MANFYTEHPELKFHLNNPMMERICQLKERDYRENAITEIKTSMTTHRRTMRMQSTLTIKYWKLPVKLRAK